MLAYVMNLDRDTERWAMFQQLNSDRCDFTRFSAVDGRTLDRQKLLSDGIIADPCGWTAGSLGSAMSHLTLWKTTVETGMPITVVEDDAVLAPDFAEASEQVLASLPEDWAIVLWGWNFDAYLWAEIPEGVAPCRMEFGQPELRANLEVFRREKRPHVAIRLRHAFGLMAYTISPGGAEAMLETCLPLTDRLIELSWCDVVVADGPIGIGMNRIYPSIPSYVCVPPLVVSENLHEESRTR